MVASTTQVFEFLQTRRLQHGTSFVLSRLSNPLPEVMDLIENIRRDLGFIHVEGQPAIESAIKELRGNLGRALNSLSDELYSKATHFLLEFIQNADDNSYPEGTESTLKISLEPGWLVIECNEIGFQASNVKALCKIGASTKKNQEGYIGEKGIGFKAVFKIADMVYILSREYSFLFDRNQELGMIAPIWTTDYLPRDGWTTFRLKLSSEQNARSMESHLTNIRPSLLLFLRKLRRLDISIGDQKRIFCRQESGRDVILENETGNSTATERYLVVKHDVSTYTQEPKRSGIRQSQIVLAFPLAEDGEPAVQDQAIYAFLPLRTYGFKFIIQGDFLTPSSREDILADLVWNTTLRDAIATAFLAAIPLFQSRPALQFKWLHFIPDGISDTFMRPVQDTLLKKLKEEPIIMCSDGVYRPPKQVLMKPYRGKEDAPLISPRFLNNRFYLSSRYDLDAEGFWLRQLGVAEMSCDDLISGLGNMDGQYLDRQDDAWHESVCSHLLDVFSTRTRWRVRGLRIIPLVDGTWASSYWSNVHFSSSSGDIPTDLGINFVRHFEQTSSRYRLFQQLGITAADVKSIAGRIVDIHSKQNHGVARSSLLVHIRYLFDHRHELESILSSSLNLWVGTDKYTIARSSELYMDHPRFPEELPLSMFLKAPFIAGEYMHLYPRDSRDFKAWCNWLQDHLGIHASPRVLDESLSPEFSNILQNCKTDTLLLVIRQYWLDVKDKILSAPGALAELRATLVTCTNGSREPLESTFLATKHLKQYDDLPFLPVADPNDPAWEFLEHLGVSLKLDGVYSLKRLIRLSKDNNADREEVERLYRVLELRFDEGDNSRTIRDAFKSHPLVYASRDSITLRGKTEWMSLSDVVWAAPLSVRSKCPLNKHYDIHFKNFFLSVGVSADCPPGILLDEIKPISTQWKGKTITADVYKRVSDILYDINKVIFYTSKVDQPAELGWLSDLRQEAIFPVNSPSLGLTLLSIHDTFYLPDRSGAMAELFSKEVPMIVNPTAFEKPAKSLSVIKHLLECEQFRPCLRRLDQVVWVKTIVTGDRIRESLLSDAYAKRMPYIRRLIQALPKGHQRRSPLTVDVYRADSVEVSYTVDEITHCLPGDLALELDEGHGELSVIIGASCKDSDHDMVLSKKMAELFNLEPANVHLAIATALDSVESLFTSLGVKLAPAQEDDEEMYWQEDLESAGLALQRKPAPDFTEIFTSAEEKLKQAGARASLSHSNKYRLNYGFGAVAIDEAQGCILNSTSYSAPIDVPCSLDAHVSNGGGFRSGPSVDETMLDALGEYFVFHGLKSNLPKFSVDNWTSPLRGRVPNHEVFKGCSLATFSYADVDGKLTESLYGVSVREEWSPQWPTYLLNVKTTAGKMAASFRMSRIEFETAAKLTIDNPNVAPATIYAIVRVADIKFDTRSFRIFPDPHRLMYDKKITVEGRTSVAIVL